MSRVLFFTVLLFSGFEYYIAGVLYWTLRVMALDNLRGCNVCKEFGCIVFRRWGNLGSSNFVVFFFLKESTF